MLPSAADPLIPESAALVLGPVQQEFRRRSVSSIVISVGTELCQQNEVPDRALVFRTDVEILLLAPETARFL